MIPANPRATIGRECIYANSVLASLLIDGNNLARAAINANAHIISAAIRSLNKVSGPRTSHVVHAPYPFTFCYSHGLAFINLYRTAHHPLTARLLEPHASGANLNGLCIALRRCVR